VVVGGRDLARLSAHKRSQAGVFLVPEGRGIFPSLSVEENLSVWLRRPDERERAFERFPVLAERRRQSAGTLSGGEQQMLALVAALVRPPTVLVVDEPSLGLAPLIVGQVYAALRELRDRGTAILLVEEKAHDVIKLADSIAFMRAGLILWHAPTADVDEERLVSAYLGIGDDANTNHEEAL
jgi:ABC-type branched-subunit amino acid transport system ATPase component